MSGDGGFSGADAHVFGYSVCVLAVDVLEVAHEFEIGREDCVDVVVGEGDLGVFGVVVARGVLLCVELGDGEGCLAGVSDLAAVPAHLFVLFPVVACVVEDLPLVDGDGAVLLPEALLDEAEVELEDFAGGFEVEGWVVEADVDSGGKGFVEVADAVGCEEEDAGVVF